MKVALRENVLRFSRGTPQNSWWPTRIAMLRWGGEYAMPDSD